MELVPPGLSAIMSQESIDLFEDSLPPYQNPPPMSTMILLNHLLLEPKAAVVAAVVTAEAQ